VASHHFQIYKNLYVLKESFSIYPPIYWGQIIIPSKMSGRSGHKVED